MADGNSTPSSAGVLLGLDLRTIIILLSAGGGLIAQWALMGGEIGRQSDDIRALRSSIEALINRASAVETKEAVDMSKIENLTNAVSDLQRR